MASMKMCAEYVLLTTTSTKKYLSQSAQSHILSASPASRN